MGRRCQRGGRTDFDDLGIGSRDGRISSCPTIDFNVPRIRLYVLAVFARDRPADFFPAFAALGYPDALLNATQSTEFLGSKIARMYSQESADVTREWIRSELYERGLGISDASEDEIDRSWDERGNAYRSNRILANAVRRS